MNSNENDKRLRNTRGKCFAIEDFGVGNMIYFVSLDNFNGGQFGQKTTKMPIKRFLQHWTHFYYVNFIVSHPTPNVVVKNGGVLTQIFLSQQQHALEYYRLSSCQTRAL